MADMYERCPICAGKLTTSAPMMVDGLGGYTGPLATGSNCPCTYGKTPGWAKTGLTSRQVERLVAERTALALDLERARALLQSVVKAWVYEASQGDGVMDENSPVLDAARDFLEGK